MAKRILRLLGGAITALLVVALLTLLLVSISPLLAGRNPSRTTFLRGYAPMVVLGGSMEPTYHIGSILFIKEIDVADVGVGDVITFATPQTGTRFEGTLTTHRVTAIESESGRPTFHTKGDANNAEDTWVVPGATVVGRGSFSIPYLGYVSSFVRSKTGFLALVIIPAALIVLLEIVSILKAIRERTTSTPAQSGQELSVEETP